ncbi:helix-hairpin-helix domain-containing protein [Amycolatopsis sp. WQ 127309]|uniref:helix-hairpin-helix domain-containing protein n=1 Tax=Amycolatopsis sp. WQ 127309 TaxID=2932773 RepID=UPI001FF1316D|nr:helix-hairpin-helix domain-containing protein [Amycolatopsis sp. WQ 127309]UOZ09550.1 helix-hairpin-helix domain-containing protein [Amycolatopsis sp. WQ 127309]
MSELLKLANIGPAMVRDLSRLGITEPAQLAGRDPVELYERLCATDGRRHDPCVLDTFMSAVDQADGAPPRPWWTYTPERKRLLGDLSGGR